MADQRIYLFVENVSDMKLAAVLFAEVAVVAVAAEFGVAAVAVGVAAAAALAGDGAAGAKFQDLADV